MAPRRTSHRNVGGGCAILVVLLILVAAVGGSDPRSSTSESSTPIVRRRRDLVESKRAAVHDATLTILDIERSNVLQRRKRHSERLLSDSGTRKRNPFGEGGEGRFRVSSVSKRSVDGSAASAEGQKQPWAHVAPLDDAQRVLFSWRVHGGVMELKVEARTRGWVGLGFSTNGGMAGADMAVAWVDDSTGRPHVVDCYGAERAAAPLVDVVQNYEVLRGSQNATHSVVELRRLMDTCDVQHDLSVGEDTARVIWAMGESDPGEGAAEAEAVAAAAGAPVPGLRGHGPMRRGGRSLHLTAPPGRSPPPIGSRAHDPHARSAHGHGDDVREWDIRMPNVTIPGDMDTLYWCKIFRAPPLARKHHIIGFAPWLQKDTAAQVHHMVLYECAWPRASFRVLDAHAEALGRPCYANDMPDAWERCLTPVASWAVGSEGEMFPDHVGLPLAMGEQAQYFMLEVHYDNPSLRKSVDSSGLRLWYTERLRRYDGGVLATGVTVTPLHVIPPRQSDFRTAGYCSGACTRQTLPAEGVRLTSVLLHAHLAARRLRLLQLRNGRLLRDVVRDDKYDFRYQQSRRLAPEVHLRPGDELVTECAYSTQDRTQPTFGGYSTQQEMCLAFVLYYPRSPIAACVSMTPVKYFFWAFGVARFYGAHMDAVERGFLKLDAASDARNPGESAVRATSSSTTTTTSTTTTPPLFVVEDPEMAMDEELNRKAIQALKKMRGFTEEGVSAGASGIGIGATGSIGDLVIAEPAEFRNKTFRQHLRQLPWSEATLARSLEKSLYHGEHMVFCRMPDDMLAMAAAIYNFPNFTDPAENKTSTCGNQLPLTPAGATTIQAELTVALTVVATMVARLVT